MNNRTIWGLSTSVSLLLFASLFWFVDWPELSNAISKTRLELLLVAILPLSLEVLITSKRIQYCAGGFTRYSTAVYSNAWYVLWLTVLPARLGEVAGIGVFKRNLQMTTGGAAASIVVQRIYDLIVLCVFLIALLSQSLFDPVTAGSIAVLALLFLCLFLANLTACLSLIARCLSRFDQHKIIWRTLMKLTLQARTWHKHHHSRSTVAWLTAITFLKWSVNLCSVVIIFIACGIDLAFEHLLVVGVVIHFLAAIPVQSVGGFGVVEVGLTGIFVAYGVDAPVAVATSLVLRFISLTYTGVFFGASFAFLRPR